MKRQTRKNKKWMRNRDQLKNPKIFTVKMIRLKDGSFQLIGGQSQVLERKNQYSMRWVNVDTRDLACEIRRSKVTSL